MRMSPLPVNRKLGDTIVNATLSGNWALFELRAQPYRFTRYPKCHNAAGVVCPCCPGHPIPAMESINVWTAVFVSRDKDSVVAWAEQHGFNPEVMDA